jgi:hypothetical protein
MSSSPSQICMVDPSTWTSTVRPARCLPQLICCQAMEITPLVVIRREIHPSPDRERASRRTRRGDAEVPPPLKPDATGSADR